MLSCRLSLPHRAKSCFGIQAERSEFKPVKIWSDLLSLENLSTTMKFRSALLPVRLANSEAPAWFLCASKICWTR